MAGAGVRVMTEGRGRALGAGGSSSGVVDGENVDWPSGAGTATCEVVQAHGNLGATETIDPTLGSVHTGTLDDDTTITLLAAACPATSILLYLTQDGTGGWSITWAGSVTEIGAPDTTAGTTNLAVATTVDGGTSWVVAWVGSGIDPDELEAAGHWELMVDGGSPPAFLENGSGTDYLYVWVPG